MSKLSDLINAGKRELGKPYVYGAEGPGSFDCSSLMQYIFGQVGIKLPRVASAQQDATTPVSKPVAGDLVFWGDPAYHVALYLGGNKILVAPKSGDVVKITNLYGSPTFGRVKGLNNGVSAPLDGITQQVGSSSGDTGNIAGWQAFALNAVFAVTGLSLIGWGAYTTMKGDNDK